ncbi:MAG: S8 family serine peptidase [Clostridium sp.]
MEKNITGQGVTIAVIDTGCETKHMDLKDQIIGGRNFTKEDNSNPDIFEDYNGHGTHVCGTIAAKGDNLGLIGVAPEAKLLILKVLDKDGSGDLNGLIKAIKYAVEKKVDIISMSLGTSANIKELYEAIKLAVQSEIELYAQLIKNTIELNMKRTIQGNGMLKLNFKSYK